MNEKCTIMFIPHSTEQMHTYHVNNFNLVFVSAILVLLCVFLIPLSLSLSKKIKDYEVESYKNQYFKVKLKNIYSIKPKINKSLKKTTDELYHLFYKIQGKKYKRELEHFESEFSENQNSMVFFKNWILDVYQNYRGLKRFFRNIPSIFPVIAKSYFFTSVYGWRIHPITLQRNFHPAFDIATLPSSPIRATANGVIEYSGWRGGYGLSIIIKHHYGFETRYAHMMKFEEGIMVGKEVKRGDIIGYVGSTGTSTGYHLHYEVWSHGEHVNPNIYLYLDQL